jgi:hypothetical protein
MRIWPDKALVLCVDEKAQIQALDRSQPLLPMRLGQAERRTADYERHGTINLFAALNVKTGTVIGEFHRRHRAVEFRRFLETIDAAVPPGLELHLILDNLRHPQDPCNQALAVAPSALSPALHSDRCLLAQPRRALVRPADGKTTAPWRSPQYSRTGGRHPRLPRPPQP